MQVLPSGIRTEMEGTHVQEWRARQWRKSDVEIQFY